MCPILQNSGLLVPSLQGDTDTPANRVELGWPGLDPIKTCLDIVIFDDSGSLNLSGGNDPTGNRYREADAAIEKLAKWCRSSQQQIAVIRFDYPDVPLIGPSPLNTREAVSGVRKAISPPLNQSGSSELTPAMMAATVLAQRSGAEVVRCTIFSDFELLDPHGAQPYLAMQRFPGIIHAVVMNATPPLELQTLNNVLISEVSSEDPPGMLAATLAHSLTATRRGTRTARTKRAT